MIGAIVTGTMGVRPDASRQMVETLPHLTAATAWAELQNVTVFTNQITVKHFGNAESDLSNQSGPPILWKAGLPVNSQSLLVDGKSTPAAREGANSYATITVAPGQTRKVRLK